MARIYPCNDQHSWRAPFAGASLLDGRRTCPVLLERRTKAAAWHKSHKIHQALSARLSPAGNVRKSSSGSVRIYRRMTNTVGVLARVLYHVIASRGECLTNEKKMTTILKRRKSSRKNRTSASQSTIDFVETDDGVSVHVHVPVNIRNEAGAVCAGCDLLGVYTQGSTETEARKNMDEAIYLFLESCISRNVLFDVLKERGFVLTDEPTSYSADVEIDGSSSLTEFNMPLAMEADRVHQAEAH